MSCTPLGEQIAEKSPKELIEPVEKEAAPSTVELKLPESTDKAEASSAPVTIATTKDIAETVVSQVEESAAPVATEKANGKEEEAKAPEVDEVTVETVSAFKRGVACFMKNASYALTHHVGFCYSFRLVHIDSRRYRASSCCPE